MKHGDENTIGLFPLRVFLLPGEQTTLHIYEPQYLELINKCFDNNLCFGIPYQGKTTLSEFGSLVWVNQILKTYPNGELDILIECKQNFKLVRYEHISENSDYPSGSITLLRSIENEPTQEVKNITATYLQLLHGEDFNTELTENFKMRNIVKMINLSDDEKIRFMKIIDEGFQNLFLIRKLKFMLILLQQERRIDANFHWN